VRVLVVEDDLNVARQVSDTLRQAMYVVDVVHDGEEGQFRGNTEPYDVVILDLGLPKLDGLSVLQQWRQAGRHHFDGTWGWPPTGGVVSGAVRSSPFTGVAASARGYPQRKCTTAAGELSCGGGASGERTQRLTGSQQGAARASKNSGGEPGACPEKPVDCYSK